MSAETRDALERALADWNGGVGPATTDGDRLAEAAEAHLASDRSEAVAALERVRTELRTGQVPIETEEGDEPFVSWGWVDHTIDIEIARLREGTA